MDDPPPDHHRLRDSAVLGRFGRFLPAFGRHFQRLGAPSAACARCRGGGRTCLDGHAHPGRGHLGVGQLEVPEARAGRRHHLRPLDADPEASARRLSQDLDRRVACGRAHHRWRHVRRGRRRRERVPGGGTASPAGRSRPDTRRGRSDCSSITPAPEAPPRGGRRATAAGPIRASTGSPGRSADGNAEATATPFEQRAGQRKRRTGARGARRGSRDIRAA